MTELIPTTEINEKLQNASPHEILEYALDAHDSIAISFSGAEDVALVHMAAKIKPNVHVFCLDTGRLHPETYRFIDKVKESYAVQLDILFPDAGEVEALVREKGLFSFYKDEHKECCRIRKVGPLRHKLLTLDAWVTGQRHDQSPTRSNVPVIQADKAFSRPGETLMKYNPLANWSSQQVWDYIRALDIPHNELHSKGYISIGCEPCTRPVLPGEHERSGRWWWEESTQKECGLHTTNLGK